MLGALACRSLRVYDADKLPVLRALALELHKAVFLGEQCVISTETNIAARMNSSATLTNDDISSNNCLAAVDFDAKRLLSESRPFLVLPPAFLCATVLYLSVSSPGH